MKNIILNPHVSEKSVKLMDRNKLAFIVDKKAEKEDVKEAVKELFGEEVSKIWTMITMKGKKKAIVKFKKEGAAADIATKLGVL